MQPIYEYLLSKTNKSLYKANAKDFDKLSIDNSVTPRYKTIIEDLLLQNENGVLDECKYWETNKGLHIVYNKLCKYPTYSRYDKVHGVQFIVNIDDFTAYYVLSHNGVYVGDHFSLDLPNDNEPIFLSALSEEINKIEV